MHINQSINSNHYRHNNNNKSWVNEGNTSERFPATVQDTFRELQKQEGAEYIPEEVLWLCAEILHKIDNPTSDTPNSFEKQLSFLVSRPILNKDSLVQLVSSLSKQQYRCSREIFAQLIKCNLMTPGVTWDNMGELFAYVSKFYKLPLNSNEVDLHTDPKKFFSDSSDDRRFTITKFPLIAIAFVGYRLSQHHGELKIINGRGTGVLGERLREVFKDYINFQSVVECTTNSNVLPKSPSEIYHQLTNTNIRSGGVGIVKSSMPPQSNKLTNISQAKTILTNPAFIQNESVGLFKKFDFVVNEANASYELCRSLLSKGRDLIEGCKKSDSGENFVKNYQTLLENQDDIEEKYAQFDQGLVLLSYFASQPQGKSKKNIIQSLEGKQNTLKEEKYQINTLQQQSLNITFNFDKLKELKIKIAELAKLCADLKETKPTDILNDSVKYGQQDGLLVKAESQSATIEENVAIQDGFEALTQLFLVQSELVGIIKKVEGGQLEIQNTTYDNLKVMVRAVVGLIPNNISISFISSLRWALLLIEEFLSNRESIIQDVKKLFDEYQNLLSKESDVDDKQQLSNHGRLTEDQISRLELENKRLQAFAHLITLPQFAQMHTELCALKQKMEELDVQQTQSKQENTAQNHSPLLNKGEVVDAARKPLRLNWLYIGGLVVCVAIVLLSLLSSRSWLIKNWRGDGEDEQPWRANSLENILENEGVPDSQNVTNMLMQNGNKITGTYKNGSLTSGIILQPDGGIFNGDCKPDGKPNNGEAKNFKLTYGDQVTGTYQDGFFKKGIVLQPGGGTFDGDFTNEEGPDNGEAKNLLLPNGAQVTGTYKNGRLTSGIILQPGGGTFNGDFTNSFPYNGEAKNLLLLNGDQVTGTFKNGRLTSDDILQPGS